MEFFEKITVYPNQTINDNCIVEFMGRHEKLASKKQP